MEFKFDKKMLERQHIYQEIDKFTCMLEQNIGGYNNILTGKYLFYFVLNEQQYDQVVKLKAFDSFIIKFECDEMVFMKIPINDGRFLYSTSFCFCNERKRISSSSLVGLFFDQGGDIRYFKDILSYNTTKNYVYPCLSFDHKTSKIGDEINQLYYKFSNKKLYEPNHKIPNEIFTCGIISGDMSFIKIVENRYEFTDIGWDDFSKTEKKIINKKKFKYIIKSNYLEKLILDKKGGILIAKYLDDNDYIDDALIILKYVYEIPNLKTIEIHGKTEFDLDKMELIDPDDLELNFLRKRLMKLDPHYCG